MGEHKKKNSEIVKWLTGTIMEQKKEGGENRT